MPPAVRCGATLSALLLFFTNSAAALTGLPRFFADAGLDYTPEQVNCAACEAVAQALEAAMATGKHLSKIGHKRKGQRTDTQGGDGAIERMDLLFGVCDAMGKYVPAKLEKTSTLHFTSAGSTSTSAGSSSGGRSEVTPVLTAFCQELVEQHEDALLETMRDALPIEVPEIMRSSAGLLRYELKEAVCVRATESCTDERLNAISFGRIALLDDASVGTKSKATQMLKEFAKQAKQPSGMAGSRASASPRSVEGEPARGEALPPSGGAWLEELGPVAAATVGAVIAGVWHVWKR